MKIYSIQFGGKIIFYAFFFCVVVSISAAMSESRKPAPIAEIQYIEKEIIELPEIGTFASKKNTKDAAFYSKVDELIGLLEQHKNAAEDGQQIDILQEKVEEVNDLLKLQSQGPPKIGLKEFDNSLCFRCHNTKDFSPSDKTSKQWRLLIEDNGHAIFDEILWEYPNQKEQILNFLLENAGNYRAEGIGVWD